MADLDRTTVQPQQTAPKIAPVIEQRPFSSNFAEPQTADTTEPPQDLGNSRFHISRVAISGATAPEPPSDSQQQFSLQRQSNRPMGPVSPEFENSLSHARRGGSPMEPKIQTQMESAMGADFSRVKVHTDIQADQLSRSIQAKAFTTGNDVFFKQGAYAPNNRSGQELLAHELTHVMQQGGSSIRRKDELTDDSEKSNIDNVIDSLQDRDDLEEPIFTDESNPDDVIESMQYKDDSEDIVFSDKPKKKEMIESSQTITDQTQDKKNKIESSSNKPDKQPENNSQSDQIASSLKATTKAYASAENDTFSIEKLKYAFEEDKKLIAPFKDTKSDDVTKTIEAIETAKKEAESKSKLSLKDNLLNDEKVNNYKQKIHIYEQKLEYLKGFSKHKLSWPEEWKKVNNRASDANYFHKTAVEQKSYIFVFLKQVQKLRKTYSDKSGHLFPTQRDAKQLAKKEAQDLAEKSTRFATNIRESYGRLKDHKTYLVKHDRMAPGFIASFTGKENSSPWKYFKKKGWPKTKEKVQDMFFGLATGGFKKVVGDKDKRGYAKPLRRTNILKEAKAAKQTIEQEYKVLQSIDIRSEPQRLFDCQVVAFQTADKVVLENLSRVLTFVKAYIIILQAAIPPIAPILEILSTALSVISFAIKLLQTAINFIIGVIRTAQMMTSNPVVKSILRTSLLNATIDGFSSAAKTIGFGLEHSWNTNGNDPKFKVKNPKTDKKYDGLTQNQLISYPGVKPGETLTTTLVNEGYEEIEGYKNYNSVLKDDLGKGHQESQDPQDNQNKFVPHDEAVISVTGDALKEIIIAFNLFRKDSKKMDQGLDQGTGAIDQAQNNAQKEQISKEDTETLNETEEASSTMKTSKSVFEMLKSLVSK